MAGKYIQIKVHDNIYISCVRLINKYNPPDLTFDTILIRKRICLEIFLKINHTSLRLTLLDLVHRKILLGNVVQSLTHDVRGYTVKPVLRGHPWQKEKVAL
jgi:hypothetical protein